MSDKGVKDMNAKGKEQTVETKKIVVISVLLIASVAIIGIGALLVVSGAVYGVNYTVMNSQINGAVFGLVMVFLGIRYFLSALKLRAEVYKTSSHFSWNNFKRTKEQKC